MGTPENVKSFEDKIHYAIYSGEKLNNPMVVGATPDIYRQYGAKADTITISPKTIEKIVFPENYLEYKGKHNLGEAGLSQIPTQIANPTAILRSNTDGDGSLVIETNMQDYRGDPIVVALKLNANGTMTLENRIASAYGKENMQSMRGDHDGNVLWRKKSGSNQSPTVTGLQLPGSAAESASTDTSISDSAENSNTQNKKISGGNIADESKLGHVEKALYDTKKESTADSPMPTNGPTRTDYVRNDAAALSEKGSAAGSPMPTNRPTRRDYVRNDATALSNNSISDSAENSNTC